MSRQITLGGIALVGIVTGALALAFASGLFVAAPEEETDRNSVSTPDLHSPNPLALQRATSPTQGPPRSAIVPLASYDSASPPKRTPPRVASTAQNRRIAPLDSY
jgi:hypothetical protein